MKIQNFLRTTILCAQFGLWAVLQVVPSAVQAESQAHEHGVGHLNLAIEGHEVEIELMAPGADVIGFEHQASTPEQRTAVQQRVIKLKAGADLFRFPALANCKLEKAEVEPAQMEDHDSEEHDHVREDHAGEHKDGEDESHAEFHARYHFECSDTGAITHIETRYFQIFPAARELEVQYVTPRGQGARELTAQSPRLQF